MRKILTAVLVATGAIVTACGGSGGSAYNNPLPGPSPNPSPPGTSSPPASQPDLTIVITSQNGAQSFDPNPADAGGKTVVFRNDDDIPHRVVLNDGTIDTGNLAPGQTSAAVVMPAAGTHYHCSLHPDMVGSVRSETGADPPVCVGYC